VTERRLKMSVYCSEYFQIVLSPHTDLSLGEFKEVL
jgi:hypothetical protein